MPSPKRDFRRYVRLKQALGELFLKYRGQKLTEKVWAEIQHRIIEETIRLDDEQQVN